MKRLFALLLVFVLAAAACGSDEASDTGGDETSTTAATDEAGGDEAADGEMAALDELNVAYFAEWPTPNQIGQEDGSFSDAVGVPVNWVPFNSGGEMAEAMESGDIDISYSQGLTPFANFANNGADIRVVGIAVAYAEADNCVARGELGVTRDNAAETLVGATVMTPTANVTHYKMLSMMEFLGVSLDDITVVPAESGPTTAAAFESGDIDVGCAFGGSVEQMLAADGNLIMTGAEQESDIGIFTYDIVSIPTGFGEEHPDVVTSFLSATEDFNEQWAADPATNNPIIAQAAGMEDVGNFLDGDVWFSFPTIEEQLSADWLGGYVQDNMKEQLQTFVDLGEIDSVLDDFSPFVDTSYLEAVNS
ncbi:MAG: ABC transporter substrate-binding protein [Acidimicrobiia bacterium]|nr:ABC transporter substrate-binding protein [Acidimicrobiia bacterium]MDH5236477.1 ABC transporter substrate-binding protein [Acidimicrobiia bacterium]